MLAEFGTVTAVEPDPMLHALARERRIARVVRGGFPLGNTLRDERFNLIGLFDVLEHVVDDIAALGEVVDRLAADGLVLLTVPAYQWLWSHHDDVNLHQRRYSRATLEHAVRSAGLEVLHVSYFNTILFPIALVARLAARLLGQRRFDEALVRIPPGNGLLARILGAEAGLVRRFSMPMGLSLLLMARRRADDTRSRDRRVAPRAASRARGHAIAE